MIDIYDYLLRNQENVPSWLEKFRKGDKPPFGTLLQSRIIYYPGAGTDGQPIKSFNKSHFAHIFFYVDYGMSKERILQAFSEEEAIKGYQLVDVVDYQEKELTPYSWKQHYRLNEREVEELRQHFNIHNHPPFCIFAVFEREETYDDSHGAKRFAVLYLCGDAIGSYDAIFANRGVAPYLIVLQDHGFGGNYNVFSRGGALETIAKTTNTIPEYALIAQNTHPWEAYEKINNVTHVLGSGHLRWLYKKKHL